MKEKKNQRQNKIAKCWVLTETIYQRREHLNKLSSYSIMVILFWLNTISFILLMTA